MKPGISSSYFAALGHGIYDSVVSAEALGFSLVEMGAAHAYEKDVFDTIERIKKKFPSLDFTVHAYFPPAHEIPHQVNLSKGLKENRTIIDGMFRAASILEAKVVSMHPGSKARYISQGKSSVFSGFTIFRAYGEEKKREEIMPYVEECIEYALGKSSSVGIPFAIETMQRVNKSVFLEREEYLEVFAKYQDLRLLIDIGHCYHSYNDPFWFLDNLSDRVVEMHVHDFDGKLDHIPLGTGICDMEKLFSYEITKKIPLIFEHAGNISKEDILKEKKLVENYYEHGKKLFR
ncbi:hypothetical protein COT47_00385 [Candidatus Woesearchaeota archaeon CG08_land_8_20_14_0_20_43_7]|nr:MAG: hypothetical protein COT47_00385 [Candidatus Woesearchaeota archaeon CG08_land_8_20_14_0_20_43_7]